MNLFDLDLPLRQHLARRVDPANWFWAEERLRAWGALCGGPVLTRAEVIDRNPPRLERYDRWGHEIDRVVHHPDALATKRDLCEAGFTSFRWSDDVRGDPTHRQAGALLGSVFTYLLCQSDTGMACACGMTSGVAEIVDRFADDEVREEFLPHLTSMDFDQLWDGSMFMTERSGGSDLSNTETSATKDGETWLLEGEKWFCSNIDGKAILTLARPEGAEEGTKGLALFLVPSVFDGVPNGIKMRRLKDKLGTRSVPTGEVLFDRSRAYRIGEPGVGINRMMEMVNLSRLGVALMGAGIARRTLMEAVAHAGERTAFGRKLRDHPMVRETLVDMQVRAEAALVLCMETAWLGGKADAGTAEPGDAEQARILTPLAKIRATRTGLQNAIEAVEIFGGNGYIEDWPTARQLRDAQCHTIWEGTENINSLDVLRAIAKQGAHEALIARVEAIVSEAADNETAELISRALDEARRSVREVVAAPELHARRLANFLADIAASALLLDSAGESDRARLVASYHAARTLGSSGRFPDLSRWLADDAFSEIVSS